MSTGRTILRSAVAVVVSCAAFVSPGRTEAPIRFTIGWLFDGAQPYWPLAQDRGCFARAGLDVRIDRGAGSSDTATKIAAGAYDLGQLDFNTMVDFNNRNPDKKLIAIFMIADGSPMAIASLRKGNIKKPEDLVGKQIVDTVGESSRVMFPALAHANGINPSNVGWINVAPNLRAQLVAQGRADAAAGQWYTLVAGLQEVGVKEEDIEVMRYSDWGVKFFGGAVGTTRTWLDAHPEAAKAFLSCTVEGIKGSIADKAAAIESLRKRNSLLNDAVATDTLNYALEVVTTPNVMANGLSFVTPERLDTTLRQATGALGIPMPDPADVWSDKYLPPRDRLRLD